MSNQKGFTLVEGLLFILIVAIVAFGGYTVWQNNKNENKDSSTTAQSESTESENSVDSNTGEASPETAPEPDNAPEGWQTYKGDGFSFIYPKAWDTLEDLSEDWQPARVAKAEGFEVGGGLGFKLAYNNIDSNWIITGLSRFPDDYKVGDEYDLENRVSDTGVVVYDYTSGDGPFSSTDLLFVIRNSMVKISLPSVCHDSGCSPESTYERAEIIDFSEQISKSVRIN